MENSIFVRYRALCAAAALGAAVAMTPFGHASAQPGVPKVMNLATHGVGSVLNATGIGLGKVIGTHLDTQVKVMPTAGPAQWLPQIATGEVHLGVLNNYDALHGRRADAGYEKALGGKGAPIVLLTSGTRNWLGPIASTESGIKGCADLKGKRVVTRYTGSAGITAQGSAMMANCGLRAGDYKEVAVAGGPDKGIQAVIDGTADVAASAAVGMGIIAELDARKGARFVALDPSPEAWARFREHFPAAPKKLDPDKARVGVRDTLYVAEYPFYLVAAESLSEEAAYRIVKVLWEKNQELFPLHARLRHWVKENYVDADATIPYHPGAIRFYKEVGAWTPQMDQVQARLLGKR
ncbi:MAG: TAXI family TRAP transporter solute-binding subunit [Burkholderiales bacterium]|nr:TAXI family TRAP transporter solute-binding subunit [Burkholderiales bacterium]